MLKLITMLLLLITFSYGNIANKDDNDSAKTASFNNCIINNILTLYQYDSYELIGDSISVGEYIQTHKFYFTDSSVIYTCITKTDSTSVEKKYKNSKKEWKQILFDIRGIDIEDVKLIWYIDWKNIKNSKYLGFTYNNSFYSYKYYTKESTAITEQLYSNRPNLNIPTKNVYTIYNIQGRKLFSGENLTSINSIDLSNFGAGVFFVNVVGYNFNKSIQLGK